MKVYLDDNRITPIDWTRTYTVEETIALLQTRTVTHLSLDNDLGIAGKENEGYQVIRWLEDMCDPRNDEGDPTFPIPEYIYVHSVNNAAIKDMRAGIAKLNKWRDEK